MAAFTSLPPGALAALSALVLLLLLEHRASNLGRTSALIFLGATCVYGLVRALGIRALSEAQLGGMPYRLSQPLFSLWGVPVQELLGWTIAVGFSAYFADRMLRWLGQPTDPFRTTLLAGLGMALVCLTVESAAVVGGWWSWSLAHERDGILAFPVIALVDWGFVAIDFLLPFELWRRGAPLGVRLASLTLFPIHLAGHAWTARIPGPLPFSGFDLVHFGLIAFVVAAAAMSKGESPWPRLADERQRSRVLIAAVILVGTCALQLVLARKLFWLWTGLPLLALALFVWVARRESPPAHNPWPWRRAAALFAALLILGLAWRWPAAERSRRFVALVRVAAEALVAKKPDDARASLEQALVLRPNHSEALWLLGWAELQRGDRVKARQYLEAALARRPDAVEAARLLASIKESEQ